MNKEWSNKEFWSKYWEKEKPTTTEFTFSKIVEKYINFNTISSYMEIGGAPGAIVTYIHNKYKLKCSIIDYVDKKYTENILKENNVTNYCIYEEDFINFNPSRHKHKYGLVASWGFIEHFDKSVCKKIIQKQKELVEENGYLLIELPNIRKFNWLIYRICNYELLKIHNLDIMDLSFIQEEVSINNEFEILYCDYYLTSFFFFNSSSEFFDRHNLLKKIFKSINKLAQFLHFDNIRTKFFSPYIVLIAKKKALV
jgi:hypothetical protein